MNLTEVGALLDPAPLPLETGYERLPDGVLHVAVRTDMPGCTGEMFEWWFWFRPDTQQYVWWHPVDHMFSDWAGTLSDETHVGSEHVIVERLTELPAQNLIAQFRDPGEFFDPDAYAVARKTNAVSAAVLGRVGMSHEPPRTPDGTVLGGRMLHVGRDTRWGMVLRSHFFLGADLPALGRSADELRQELPDALAVAAMQHVYNEFTFLSRFLPSLYLGEHRDKLPVPVPW
jgi:DAPG hydrolase PhiG domain